VESSAAARIGLADSAAAYLEPGEEIVVVEGGQAVDFWKGRRGIQDQPTPADVSFVKHQMGVVITTRRFLMFKLGGLLRARADELLTNLPVGEVDSIVCVGHSFKSFEVKLTIHGIEYGFIVAHIGRCHYLEKALEAAKRGEPAV
jgi:hypothetical protein